MAVTVYHNPDCGTSRNTLRLLRHLDIEPEVVPYLETPPGSQQLMGLAQAAGRSLRDLVRERGTPFAALGLGRPEVGDADLLAAIAVHPILINRPIVVTPAGTALCRPSERVLDLLPPSIAAGRGDCDKEDGSPFLADAPAAAEDPGLRAALAAEGLPTDDLGEPGRAFFRYASLAGRPFGYGAFEIHGAEALVRSIVVPAEARGRGVGRGILLLLLSRAFDLGARRAWLLTSSAAPFFSRNGFAAVARETAPPEIRATRQAASLCPSSATLMTRAIAL